MYIASTIELVVEAVALEFGEAVENAVMVIKAVGRISVWPVRSVLSCMHDSCMLVSLVYED
jgi:hypothetical protein